MKVLVANLAGIVYDQEAVSVVLPTKIGEITVLPHHRPLLSILGKGTAKITDNQNKETAIEINSGFLEVTAAGTVNILLD